MASISWIFQANPKIYNVDGALKSQNEIKWRVKRYEKDIHIGDKACLWRGGADAGIIAIATVISEPRMMEESDIDRQFITREGKLKLDKEDIRVILHIDNVLKRPIYKKELLQNSILSKMNIITCPQSRNPFKVKDLEATALEGLLGKI